jgi:hypothetical protein
MKLFKNSFLFILTSTLIISACNQLETKWKTFTASNKYTVEYPSFLSPDNTLTTEASMSYSNQKKEFYCLVLDEHKDTLSLYGYEDMSLEDYVLILKNNQDALTELPTKTLLQKEIKVNGMKGEILEIETEITQGDKKTVSKGKKAILEGKNGFYQVYIWTLKEDFKKYEPDFDRIIGSFKEL